jgi:hypothetical protein
MGTCALGGLLLQATSGCEVLLGVGGLREPGTDGENAPGASQDAAGLSDDAPDLEQGQGQGATSNPNGESGVADGMAPLEDDAAPFEEAGDAVGQAETDDASAAPGIAEAGGPDAGSPASSADDASANAIADVDALGFADSSLAGDTGASPPVDSGPPPNCAAGANALTISKIGTPVAFGTVGAVCVSYKGSVGGWNASSTEGRSVTVVGSTTQHLATIPAGMNQPGIGPGADGYIYWNFTSGTYSYAAVNTFVK